MGNESDEAIGETARGLSSRVAAESEPTAGSTAGRNKSLRLGCENHSTPVRIRSKKPT